LHNSIPVLLYHHIGIQRTGSYPYLTLSSHQFRKQIRWLLDHRYTFISASEYLSSLQRNAAIESKSVLVTFDDAYADLDENALPILKEHEIPATIFVVTSQIGGTNVWDKSRGWAHSFPLLSKERIQYWASHGMEFGAHSHTHADLRTISQPALEEEVLRSKNEVELILERPIISFAYPFGAYNESVRNVVSESFELAFTSNRGVNKKLTDRYQLRRTAPYRTDGDFEMWSRVHIGWTPADRLRNLRNRLKRLIHRTQ
jgi:peptidoglycan/xylan/chitin deacetylase (PgdA/CDA1 family)